MWRNSCVRANEAVISSWQTPNRLPDLTEFAAGQYLNTWISSSAQAANCTVLSLLDRAGCAVDPACVLVIARVRLWRDCAPTERTCVGDIHVSQGLSSAIIQKYTRVFQRSSRAEQTRRAFHEAAFFSSEGFIYLN